MIAGPHRSIGEVLILLQEEFAEITISKIRFLESQGLLDPERTPSGYRKFYEDDIATLRWILEQQRDHFLPLKVIKEKLEAGGGLPPGATEDDPAPTVDEILSAVVPGLERPDGADGGDATQSNGDEQGVRAMAGSVSMTADELADAARIDRSAIDELEKYGMLSSRSAGSTQIYDDEALVVARLAAGFFDRGLEPRHVRMYKLAVDREADVFEQIITPRRKGSSPDARADTARTIDELSKLGAELRTALLRQAMRGAL